MLNLIEDDGKTTDLFRELSYSSTDEEYKQVVHKIVTGTYASIIEGVDLTTADYPRLENIFRRRNVSPSVAEKAARFFAWIAKEAGISVKASSKLVTTKSQPKVTKPAASKDDAAKSKRVIRQDSEEKVIPHTPKSADEYQVLLVTTLLENIKKTGSTDVETIRLAKEMIDELKKQESKGESNDAT